MALYNNGTNVYMTLYIANVWINNININTVLALTNFQVW
jgi:hypothetical protein